MKSVLVKILGVLSLLIFVVGLYMMINYAGKNDTMFLIFLGIMFLGLIGLGLIIFFIIRKMKKMNEDINTPRVENNKDTK